MQSFQWILFICGVAIEPCLKFYTVLSPFQLTDFEFFVLKFSSVSFYKSLELIWIMFGMNICKILKRFRKEKHNFRLAVLSSDRSYCLIQYILLEICLASNFENRASGSMAVFVSNLCYSYIMESFLHKHDKSCDMTKPTKWLCVQQRLRSAWASAQSDQSLRWTQEESLGP